MLDFRVAVGGQPYLIETLVLPQMQEDASFELLAREPQRLARLYSLAAAGAVAIAIRLDGHTLRTFSFQDFLAYNRVIRHGNLRPRVAASTVEVLAADPVFSTTGVPVNAPAMEFPASRSFAGGPNVSDECLDNCAYAFQSCMDTQCSGLKQCEECDQQYEGCSYQCQIQRQCGGSVHATSQYTEHRIDSGWYSPYSICVGFSSDGEEYDKVEFFLKHSIVRVTLYCDGTRIEHVEDVWYEETGCSYSPTYRYCPYPTFLFVPNYC